MKEVFGFCYFVVYFNFINKLIGSEPIQFFLNKLNGDTMTTVTIHNNIISPITKIMMS